MWGRYSKIQKLMKENMSVQSSTEGGDRPAMVDVANYLAHAFSMAHYHHCINTTNATPVSDPMPRNSLKRKHAQVEDIWGRSIEQQLKRMRIQSSTEGGDRPAMVDVANQPAHAFSMAHYHHCINTTNATPVFDHTTRNSLKRKHAEMEDIWGRSSEQQLKRMSVQSSTEGGDRPAMVDVANYLAHAFSMAHYHHCINTTNATPVFDHTTRNSLKRKHAQMEDELM